MERSPLMLATYLTMTQETAFISYFVPRYQQTRPSSVSKISRMVEGSAGPVAGSPANEAAWVAKAFSQRSGLRALRAWKFEGVDPDAFHGHEGFGRSGEARSPVEDEVGIHGRSSDFASTRVLGAWAHSMATFSAGERREFHIDESREWFHARAALPE